MSSWIWLSFLGVTFLYVAAVALIGFEGPLAATIHFGRIVMPIAALIIYVPKLVDIFKEIPTPRRDYLLVGLLLLLLSAIGFVGMNTAGQFGVVTSVFKNPVAGFCSLLLVGGAGFLWFAPDVNIRHGLRVAALVTGLVVGAVVLALSLYLLP